MQSDNSCNAINGIIFLGKKLLFTSLGKDYD